ncbi:hypothetical protein [Tranquillimonas alkanivorans]|uniref:Uncharacterized protein n=1 Tax=Tranquillimonas alkanivorans TaxID=441119 RepID=A0A1I5U1N2_9RHOB|nr:hypothetical protein [Tranquillimonas alkanivorans]SFP89210.1 hypothetical protein SAMN04488047_1171 [Tranquillimonas alkanivorans]
MSVVTCGGALLLPQVANASCAVGQSDRLLLWCAIERGQDGIIHPADGADFHAATVREGYLDQNAGTYGTAYVTPTLAYSGNINGGNPTGVLELGDFRFHPDESYEKTEGWLLGGAIGAQRRQSVGPGRYLDFAGGVSAAYAPAHETSVNSAFFVGCSKNHMADWWYADACYSAWAHKKELSEGVQQQLAFEVSKAFSSATNHHHLASIGIREEFDENDSQTQLTTSILTVHSKNFASYVGFALGEEVEGGALAPRTEVEVGLMTVLRDRSIELSVEYEELAGGRVLGFDREDDAWSIRASVELTKSLSLDVGYSEVTSSIDYYSGGTPLIALRFEPYAF